VSVSEELRGCDSCGFCRCCVVRVNDRYPWIDSVFRMIVLLRYVIHYKVRYVVGL